MKISFSKFKEGDREKNDIMVEEQCSLQSGMPIVQGYFPR